MTLHAPATRTLFQAEATEGEYTAFIGSLFLIDEDGNFLVDEAGDFLVSDTSDTATLQILHAPATNYTFQA